MSNIIIIVKKELYRVFGDKKLIFSLFILPAIIMIAIYSVMGNMIGSLTSDIEEHIATVTVVNATDDLKAIMDGVGYSDKSDVDFISEADYSAHKEDIIEQVRNGNIDLVVYLEPDFAKLADAYSNSGDAVPEMKIYYNSTENYSGQAYSVFAGTDLPTYQANILGNRFEDLSVLTAFNQTTEEIYKEEKANTQFISMMLPYLIVMMLFAGVMSIGVDAIAGEKERGTLSSMLISPAKRVEIVIGKLVSMAILSSISAIVYSASMIFSLTRMGNSSGLDEMGYGGISFTVIQVVELLVTMLVLVYLYVGIIGLLATISKDTKSASSLISPCYIVVIILGIMTMFANGNKISSYRYLIPVYGNAMAIKDICVNELTGANFGFSVIGTLAVALILTFAITKAFNSEKIMFNA